MMISVCMLTYNQEKYISQAINSILKQKTDFDFEIVIGDDFSTDRTREILTQYQKKNPEKIKLHLRKKNLGISQNFIKTLQACKGKYIALLEGDDYWISENKLQQQVKFLENNADFVMSCHRVRIISANSQKNGKPSRKLNKEIFSANELARDNFIYTGSCVFRNHLINYYPEWLLDWPLFLLVSQYGKIKYFPNIYGAYRQSSDGVWFPKSRIEKVSHAVRLTELCDKLLGPELHTHFQYRLAPLYLELSGYYLKSNETNKAKSFFSKSLNAYLHRNFLDRLIGIRRAFIYLLTSGHG